MNNFIKYTLLWIMCGVIGVFLTYGAVKYVDESARITSNHLINGAILGPGTLVIGIGGWLGILFGEIKN